MYKQQFGFPQTDILKRARLGGVGSWLAWQHFARKVCDYLEIVRRRFVHEHVVVQMLQAKHKHCQRERGPPRWQAVITEAYLGAGMITRYIVILNSSTRITVTQTATHEIGTLSDCDLRKCRSRRVPLGSFNKTLIAPGSAVSGSTGSESRISSFRRARSWSCAISHDHIHVHRNHPIHYGMSWRQQK